MKEKIEALNTANEYLDRLKKGILDTAVLITDNNVSEGLKNMPDICDGIDWVVQVVTLAIDTKKENIDISPLKEKLQECIESIENGDYTLLGDLLQYEVIEDLEKIHLVVKKNINN